MRTLTVAIHIKELDRRETFTFTVSDGKVHPPKEAFVDMDGEKIVLGFGIKIEKERLR